MSDPFLLLRVPSDVPSGPLSHPARRLLASCMVALAAGTGCGSQGNGNGSMATGGAGGPATGGATATGGRNSAGGTPGMESTGGQGGRPGASGSGGVAAAGSGGSAGTRGTAGRSGTGGAPATGMGGAGGPLAACSEMPIRTAPPPGKEAFRYAPTDTRFPFAGHWMGVFSADPRYIGEISLADFDRDGDLDFASGQNRVPPNLMMWWEYCGPDHFVPHIVGTGHAAWAGGNAADFDGDGWTDIIAGDSWYRNPRTPRTAQWQRFLTGGPLPEEILVGDVTGDGKPEALYVHLSFMPAYWYPGATPSTVWTKGPNLANAQQQGGAIGDIDGDGDNDILVGYRWWYRNVNGDGSVWQTVDIFAAGFDNSPLTALGDLDGDGDVDFVMGTHFGTRVAWAENMDGMGNTFAMHILPSPGLSFIHTVWAADFDNDGDQDLLIANNVGPMFIYENTDGHGAFTQHMIAANTRGHEARVADVDCDGDLDIAGTPWGDPTEGGEQTMPPRDHIYLQNMLVENGGTPRFDAARGRHEVFQAALARVCAAPNR